MFDGIIRHAQARALANSERAVRTRHASVRAGLDVAALRAMNAPQATIDLEEDWADIQGEYADVHHRRAVRWTRLAAFLGGDVFVGSQGLLGDSPVTAAARAIMEAERRRAAKVRRPRMADCGDSFGGCEDVSLGEGGER